jgi:predicted ribosome quality control (RQC) complex YloA/Tae2 family protein
MLDEAREAERSAEYERSGNAILSMLPSLRKGASGFRAPHGEVRLDPALSPVQNAEWYFHRARRARTAALEKENRLQAVDARLHAARTLLGALDEIRTDAELDSFRQTHAHELDLFGLSPKAREREELPFRVFRVHGGFDVWVGKSSANNDLLTMKYAKPRDLWLHARGASGSHVLLKIASGKGEPDKRAIEEAASIAAYYSKMKSSSLVPVAVTERRFVRKPRGSSPGSVLVEREKVVFVRPHLPHREEGEPHS